MIYLFIKYYIIILTYAHNLSVVSIIMF